MSAFGPQTASDIVSRIDLLRTSKQNYAILITEGETDVNIYSRLLEDLQVIIISASGKRNACEAAKKGDNRWDSNIVFAIDADFDRILGKKYIDRVILTDQNDMECTMISQGALRHLLNELFSSTEQQNICRAENVKSIEELLVNSASHIGRYRIANAFNNLSLRMRMESIDMTTLLCANRFAIDDNVLRSEISNQNTDRSDKVSTLWDLIDSNTVQYPVQVSNIDCCQGHDIINMLCALIKKNPAGHRLNWQRTNLETSLRLAFSKAMFLNTSMWSEIVNLISK